MTTTETPTRAEILNAEIDFMLTCGEGEHAITRALGYAGRTNALKRQLSRYGLHHLIPRIFEHDALYRESSNR